MRTPVHPLWGLVEIGGFTGLYFAVLWIMGPKIATTQQAGALFYVLILAAAIHVVWLSPVVLHQDPREWLGLWGRGRNGPLPGSFGSAWPAYALFTATAAALLVACAEWLDPARLANIHWKAAGVRFVEYLGSGLAQALIFQWFIASRLRTMLPLGTATDSARRHRFSVALLTTILFTSFHWPNLPLMAFALPAGFCWTWIYYERPNLPLIVLSHAVLGTILNRVVLLYMRIGPFYAHPDLYLWRTVVPGLRSLIGNLY